MENCCQNVRGNKTNKRPKWQQKTNKQNKTKTTKRAEGAGVEKQMVNSCLKNFGADSREKCFIFTVCIVYQKWVSKLVFYAQSTLTGLAEAVVQNWMYHRKTSLFTVGASAPFVKQLCEIAV